jgi:hypothetical protein
MKLAISNMEEFRPELESLLSKFASEPVHLFIVPDIEDWSLERSGNLVGNPAGFAIRDGVTNVAAILLRQEITEDSAQSIIQRIVFGGHESVRERLNNPKALARHLVLHELAHLVSDWGQEHEDDCDAWAFERM